MTIAKVSLSSKNFTQELMERLHDWAEDRTDKCIEISKKFGNTDWEIWIFKFDYDGSIGSFITDENCDTEDFDALLKQKREKYEELKRKKEKFRFEKE